MSAPKLQSIVRIKTVGTIKIPRHEGPVYSMNNREDFRNMSVPSEITGRIEKIENGKYFVLPGVYANGVFSPSPSGREIIFTGMYMSRFAKILV